MGRIPFLRRLPVGFFLLGGGILLALWLLRNALAPFFISIVFAYLLAPLVDRLARRTSRGTAVMIVMLSAVILLLLALWFLLPILQAQIDRIRDSWPQWRAALDARLAPWLQAHPEVAMRLRQAVEGIDFMAVLRGIGGASLGVLGWFLAGLSLLLVPLIVYYLLLEGPHLIRWVDGLLPARHRERTRTVALAIHRRLGGYIRGQLGVALVMSLFQGLGFALLAVPYAWLLGVVAGFSNLVPYSPYVTALPPAILLAAIEGAGPGRMLLIPLLFTTIQKAETLYFTPVWVGRATRLHPLEVLLAILAFGHAFGIVGLIFAVPLMITLKVVGEEALAEYRKHPWFTGEA